MVVNAALTRGKLARIRLSLRAGFVEKTHRTKGSDPPGDEIGANVLRSVRIPVIVTSLAVECTHAAESCRRSAVRDKPGHLQGLVCRYQRQALHRIRLHSLTGGHVKHARVEVSWAVNKTAVRCGGSVFGLLRCVYVRLDVEPVMRNLQYNTSAVASACRNGLDLDTNSLMHVQARLKHRP